MKMLRRSRRLGIESLETRDLMAGNVKVEVAAGSVVLTGDGAANAVTFAQAGAAGANTYLISGAPGTTINGQTTPLAITLTKNATFNLGGGSDTLTIGKTTATTVFNGRVTINTGAGADTVTLVKVLGKSGTATLGTAAQNEVDVIDVRDSKFVGVMSLVTGGGNDRLTFTRSQAAGTIKADTGAGNDVFTMNNSTLGNIELSCGAGNDTFLFAGKIKVTGNVTANGGSGTDTGSTAPGTTVSVDLSREFDIVGFEEV